MKNSLLASVLALGFMAPPILVGSGCATWGSNQSQQATAIATAAAIVYLDVKQMQDSKEITPEQMGLFLDDLDALVAVLPLDAEARTVALRISNNVRSALVAGLTFKAIIEGSTEDLRVLRNALAAQPPVVPTP